MHYGVTVFGVKDTSEEMIRTLRGNKHPVDLVITVKQEVAGKNDIAGFTGLAAVAKELGIPVYEAADYGLKDEETLSFFRENTFDLGLVFGWQRLIPKEVLDVFPKGVFGFHGNAGYLPFGRGRSPLNWSLLLGDTRFNLNLFRYDEKADSPNVFGTKMFQLSLHDDIRTAQYKNQLCATALLEELLALYETGQPIPIRTESKDFDSWYEKRTPEDGKIDFTARTREIYNLIRAVAPPFPGAFCHTGAEGGESRVKITAARPFDEMMDFHAYAPGEIIAVYDGRPIVRTVDGSLLIDRYEADVVLQAGMRLF